MLGGLAEATPVTPMTMRTAEMTTIRARLTGFHSSDGDDAQVDLVDRDRAHDRGRPPGRNGIGDRVGAVALNAVDHLALDARDGVVGPADDDPHAGARGGEPLDVDAGLLLHVGVGTGRARDPDELLALDV